jgi:hypothetical protein
MNFAGLLFLIAAHFITGRGLLQLFKLQLDTTVIVCFSFMVGVPVLSLAPCILQLLNMPITATSVLATICAITAICSIPVLLDLKKPSFGKFSLPKLYEWPVLLVLLYFISLSLWRCYFMPPYSRDMLSGPELIAEYTVREHTMINSVFNIDLTTSNNYHKSPFVTCLQVIYKLLVFPFGQLWLSILFLSITTFIYTLVRKRVHPLLAGFLLLLFTIVPEMFAYSFVILYDYSNMVFFFSGFYFLTRYLQEERINDLAFSIFLFGLATYIRTESLILITMMTPLLLLHLYNKKLPLKTIALRVFAFLIVPAAFYYLCINIFVIHFVPIRINVADNINPNLSDLAPLWTRYSEILNLLIFSYAGSEYYGYFFFIFTAIFCIDTVLFRKFNKEALYAIYGILVIYFVLNTNVTDNYDTAFSNTGDQNFILWNAYLGYKLLKNNALEIRLSAYDMLNQNKSITRTVTETYLENNVTQVLQQYFMLQLTYTLREFKTAVTGGNKPQGDGFGPRPFGDGPPPGR